MTNTHSAGAKVSHPAIPARLVIVGGGTSGWMAANWLAQHWRGCHITQVESARLGTLGVGEGSTPYLRQFFRALNIPESEWMPRCQATYKAGIRFPNWADLPGNSSYFHPFFTHLDLHSGEAFMRNTCQRRRGEPVSAHPDDYFVTAAIARQGLAPVPRQPLAQEPDYAYHFDASLLGQYLKERAQRLGVSWLDDEVTGAERQANGDIAALVTRKLQRLEGDFFIDCSGFRGLLISETLGEAFIPYTNQLLNDKAVALATSLDHQQSPNNQQPLAAETVSSALKHGWAWRIPLANRFGNGYVYSSAFISADQAETELRRHLGAAAEGRDARHISMRVGRVAQHWRNNCLALGLSQGFIEPLEATALMLVQYALQTFSASMARAQLANPGDLASAQRDYNRRLNRMFDGVRDYVVAHYLLNSRRDSDYWVAQRESLALSDSLRELLEVWDKGGDFEAALRRQADIQVYQRPSWYCLLAGMGRFPDSANLRASALSLRADTVTDALLARQYADTTAAKLFGDHRQQLQALYGQRWPDQPQAAHRPISALCV